MLFFGGISSGQTAVTSQECLDCHDGYDQTLAGSVHAIVGEKRGVNVSCADCHAGAEKHLETPEADTITNPGAVSAKEASKICSACHLTAHQQRMIEGNAHSRNNLNCESCHKVHGNTAKGLLKEAEPSLCYHCHGNIEAQFASPYRHPVENGVVTCSECHMPMDELAIGLHQDGINSVCYNCHGEFQGPFPYEHQATVEYSVEQGGCLNCHEAHGSDLPRMTKQPYGPPDFQLCSQCHIVPGHKYNSHHGSQWAGLSCNSCHMDIHGSYDNRLFLAPEIEAQGCFAAGCHSKR
jgi:DmsE family decaheme c-type cytochrome